MFGRRIVLKGQTSWPSTWRATSHVLLFYTMLKSLQLNKMWPQNRMQLHLRFVKQIGSFLRQSVVSLDVYCFALFPAASTGGCAAGHQIQFHRDSSPAMLDAQRQNQRHNLSSDYGRLDRTRLSVPSDRKEPQNGAHMAAHKPFSKGFNTKHQGSIKLIEVLSVVFGLSFILSCQHLRF